MSDLDFIARSEYLPKRCTYSVVWLLHAWCHLKQLPSRRTFCVHHAAMHNVTSLHARGVHACLAVTCQRNVWHNDRDLLRATAETRWWNGYKIRVSTVSKLVFYAQSTIAVISGRSQHRKLTLENKIFPPLLQGLEPATY